jgi:outer membrane immunogenic protein
MQGIRRTLLCGLLVMTASAWAQKVPAKTTTSIADVSVMYSVEHAKVVGVDSVWLQGGSGELAFPLHRKLGAALNVTGERSGDLGAGRGSLSKVAFVAGPRYSVPLRNFRAYSEALFGGVHGFDATFPSISGANKSANAFAMQAGGGLDIDWKRHIAIRAIEASYIRTDLPNGGSNAQNDFKLAAGIVFRILM